MYITVHISVVYSQTVLHVVKMLNIYLIVNFASIVFKFI
jgi:hypothetical protein